MAVAICGEDVSLKLSHICVGEGGAGGVAHGTSFCLGVVDTLPLEVGKAQDGFLEGDDVVDGHGGAGPKCGVLLEETSEGCNG
jgi:hypothetical protein